jgi:GxxExxY protein
MPVKLHHPIRRPSEQEFSALIYEVMRCVFDMHNDLGRFFDERIYKRELARRLPGVSLEVPLEVTFEGFRKTYFIDVLFQGAAPLEFKAVEVITDRHRAQSMNYLLLADLPHGKLVNLRPEQVEHEFINAPLRAFERQRFEVESRDWQDIGTIKVREWFTAFLRDLGTCLDVTLYEEALAHCIGGPANVEQEIEVVSEGVVLGTQKFRLLQPNAAFKVTTLPDHLEAFAAHARRLLAHTRLEVIQWVNVGRHRVTFTTIRK